MRECSYWCEGVCECMCTCKREMGVGYERVCKNVKMYECMSADLESGISEDIRERVNLSAAARRRELAS